MEKTQKTTPKRIIVRSCRTWSDSLSRDMVKAGKDASADAIAQAKAAGIATSYWKDGAVCWSNGSGVNHGTDAAK